MPVIAESHRGRKHERREIRQHYITVVWVVNKPYMSGCSSTVVLSVGLNRVNISRWGEVHCTIIW